MEGKFTDSKMLWDKFLNSCYSFEDDFDYFIIKFIDREINRIKYIDIIVH